MIKHTVIFSSLLMLAQNTFANSEAKVTADQSDLAILLTLIVAVIALVISVVNFFRISHNRKIGEVEMVNQKDDLNVTMEAIQVTLSKEIRYLRKELHKGNKPQKTREQKENLKQPESKVGSEASKETDMPKKTQKRRSSNYKRRPQTRKPANKNPEEKKKSEN